MSELTNTASAEEPKTVPELEQTVNTTPASVDEPFDKERAMATIEKLRAIEKQYKKDQKEYERLKADEDARLTAQMTEAERLKKQADELERKNAQLQADILRRDVIAETGLPAIFADRLKGMTKEEMLEDAKVIMEALPKHQQPRQSPTNPGGAQAAETDAQKRERLFGKQGNPFDFEEIKRRGGGVVFDQ